MSLLGRPIARSTSSSNGSGSSILVIGRGGRCLSLEGGEDGIEQRPGTVPHRIVGRQARLLGGRGYRGAGRLVVQLGGVQGKQATRAGRSGSAIRSCSSISSGRRGSGWPGKPSTSVAPALWQSTNTCGAEPWISPSVTPEYAGWHERALALDEEELSAATAALDNQPLGRAREEVRDHRVDRDPPPRDRDPCLAVGTKTERRPRRRASRSSSRATVFFPIAQSEPTVSAIWRGQPQVLAGGHVQAGRRFAQIAELDAVPGRELGELRVVGDELVQAALDVEAVARCSPSAAAPGGREAAALGRDADERGGRARSGALVDRGHDRDPLLVSPARVESRIATVRSGA